MASLPTGSFGTNDKAYQTKLDRCKRLTNNFRFGEAFKHGVINKDRRKLTSSLTSVNGKIDSVITSTKAGISLIWIMRKQHIIMRILILISLIFYVGFISCRKKVNVEFPAIYADENFVKYIDPLCDDSMVGLDYTNTNNVSVYIKDSNLTKIIQAQTSRRVNIRFSGGQKGIYYLDNLSPENRILLIDSISFTCAGVSHFSVDSAILTVTRYDSDRGGLVAGNWSGRFRYDFDSSNVIITKFLHAHGNFSVRRYE